MKSLGQIQTFASAATAIDFSGDKVSLVTLSELEGLRPPSGTVQQLQFSLPLRSADSDPYVPLQPGLIMLSGPTASGKSAFLRALADTVQGGIKVRRTVEPYDSIDQLGDMSYRTADQALVDCVLASSNGAKELQCIDSLRAVLFETSGPAGERGMIMPFFTALTRVSESLAANGLTVLATVNPMVQDQQVQLAFLNRLSASVSCFITLNSTVFNGGKLVEAAGTVTVRPVRQPVPFVFRPNVPRPVLVEDVAFDLVSPEASEQRALAKVIDRASTTL